MPSLATLQAFAATVEANDHVGAITKFYAPDAQAGNPSEAWRMSPSSTRCRTEGACRPTILPECI